MNITKIGNGGTHQYCPLQMPYACSDRLTKGTDHLQKHHYPLLFELDMETMEDLCNESRN